MQAKGGVSRKIVLDQYQVYQEAVKKVSYIDTQLKELDIKQVEVEKSYRENIGQINDFKSQLQELDAKEEVQLKQDFQSAITRKNQIQEVKRNIAQLEVQLNQNGQIISHLASILVAGCTVCPNRQKRVLQPQLLAI